MVFELNQQSYMIRGSPSVHYCNANSILVVNGMGKLRVIYTPFKVVCKSSIGLMQVGTIVYVDEVHISARDEILYVISSNVYAHSYFTIMANF